MIEILYIPKTSFSLVLAVCQGAEIPKGFTGVCGYHNGGDLELSFAIPDKYVNNENAEIVLNAVLSYIDREILP